MNWWERMFEQAHKPQSSYEKEQKRLITWHLKRKDNRKINKQWAVEYKGGQCEDCGFTSPYLAVFDFHHINMNEKEFNITKDLALLPENYQKKVKNELDKCSLLCANCHRIKHAKWMAESKPKYDYTNHLDIPNEIAQYVESVADVFHIGELDLDHINDFLNTEEEFHSGSKILPKPSNKGANQNAR